MKNRKSFLSHFHPSRSRGAQAGFTLLLAALVTSVVLALGAAIYQLAQKQLTLSSIGRDSQFAFYAADTAVECAFYWDFRFGYYATSTPASVVDPDPRCDGVPLNVTVTSGNPEVPPYYPYTKASARINLFQDAAPGGGYCAEVFVTKTFDAPTQAVKTIIHADGYNVNCEAVSTSPRALQRSVELKY